MREVKQMGRLKVLMLDEMHPFSQTAIINIRWILKSGSRRPSLQRVSAVYHTYIR